MYVPSDARFAVSHVDATQAPPSQDLLHVPQFIGSVVRSTPLHSPCVEVEEAPDAFEVPPEDEDGEDEPEDDDAVEPSSSLHPASHGREQAKANARTLMAPRVSAECPLHD